MVTRTRGGGRSNKEIRRKNQADNGNNVKGTETKEKNRERERGRDIIGPFAILAKINKFFDKAHDAANSAHNSSRNLRSDSLRITSNAIAISRGVFESFQIVENK